jgi:hypothetical protein
MICSTVKSPGLAFAGALAEEVVAVEAAEAGEDKGMVSRGIGPSILGLGKVGGRQRAVGSKDKKLTYVSAKFLVLFRVVRVFVVHLF